METDPLLTVTEAAHILHVHPNTVRKWTNRGLLASYRLGPRRDRRLNLQELRGFIHHGLAEMATPKIDPLGAKPRE